MYDTINLWLRAEDAPKTDLLAEVPLLFSNPKETFNYRYNCITVSGMVGHFYATVSERGVFLGGSLCKHYFGDNQHTLSLPDTKLAVEKLSDEINLPDAQAHVYRIDFSDNYVMDYPENAYYDFLGSATYYNRQAQDNGLYYTNSRRQIVFYGKVTEQRLKHVPILEEFEDKHVLRYEYRLKKQVACQLNRKEVRAFDLYEAGFYKQMLERYKSEYLSINKYNLISFEDTVLKDRKEFKKQLMLLGIQKLGGEAAVMDIISHADKCDVFENGMQRKRQRDMIKELCKTPLLTQQPELVKELDKKILDRIDQELLKI